MIQEEREKLILDESSCKSLRELVFDTIRTAIIAGKMQPGERVMEVQLAEELGVSRTPVREAIRKLELEGLVKMEPRKGAYVTPLSITDVKEMMEIRRALEMLCAELAAENATEEEIEEMRVANRGFEESAGENDEFGVITWDTSFHDQMYAASGNDRLFNMIHTLREQMQRMRIDYVHNIPQREPLIGQHEEIIENIAAHRAKEAGLMAAEHIRQVEADMMLVLQNR